jgi:non-ribosomal peptide synthetase component E (peptide arylation enzyme)
MTGFDDRVAALRDAGRSRAGARPGLGEVAMARTDESPDRVVVSQGGRSVTRGEMLDMARRLGAGLRERGLDRGAVIAFQLPNWWEACVLNLAAALFGYRLAPILPMFRAAELGMILPACGARAIFVPQSFRNVDYPAMVEGLPSPPLVFSLRGTAGANSFERLIRSSPAYPEPASGDDAKLVGDQPPMATGSVLGEVSR